MACINSDGSLTPAARSVLTALKVAATVEVVAQAVSMPVYRVRSNIREMIAAGLLVEANGQYQTTEAGVARLSK